ncbi:MAG TPA: fructosamine kinase family protein, partial [Solirubrobacterales bacterium]|nr:fructosamine kinase family protein [Solirubrobacterales bacterium]
GRRRLTAGPAVAAAGRALGVEVERARRVAGGDINEAFRLRLADGREAFLKCRAGAPAGEYELESSGLAWLGEVGGGLPVPAILAIVDEEPVRGLVLEWVEEGRLDGPGEERLGSGLARIHAAGAPGFGALPPGAPAGAPLRFGDAVELPARAGAGDPPWWRVYGERIERLAALARDAGRLDHGAGAAIAAVVERLEQLVGPAEPPARVHGDLWSGNVLADSTGTPWLIDPAAHGGHREIDLAMLRLFGSVSSRTLGAYEDVLPLAPGHEERVALWQLQPLLVHAILFGGSYGAAAGRAAARYG